MNRLLTTLLLSLTAASLAGETARPKLVVQIVVDQLRTDYIDRLEAMFGQKGFNRLKGRGVYLRNVDFGTDGLDSSSGTALVTTGAWPADNGIASATAFDQKSGKTSLTLSDPSTLGNFTDLALSPANLLVSTISDELAVDGAGLGAIYSIAADPQMAVILGGHAANSAVWINDNNGKWASSAYYGDLPPAATQRNSRHTLAQRIDTMQWKPSRPLKSYPDLPAQKRQYEFRYTFPSSDRSVYRRLVSSPLGNREVTDLALDYLRQMKLGQRGDVIDMLSLGLSAAPYKYVSDGDYRLELQDTYLRLDADLGRLMDAIESGPGLDRTVILLSSTGYYDDATPDNAKFRIPGGEFSTRRAVSLLNAMLSARYGNGNYVATISGDRLWLNHREFEKRGVDLAEATLQSRDFLAKMSGVKGAMAIADVNSGVSAAARAKGRRTVAGTAPDIYLDYAPGWTVTEDISYPPTVRPVRTSVVNTPAIIFAPEVKATRIDTPVDATVIAPTVASVLRIRSPNGSVSKPLLLD